MAERPEPLDEVLAQARRIVVAEVVEAKGAEAPRPSRPLPIGAGPTRPEQRVRLKVRETLLGVPVGELEAVKPESTYVLAAGHHGPFLLDGAEPPRILGRYGPDTYAVPVLKKALAARRV